MNTDQDQKDSVLTDRKIKPTWNVVLFNCYCHSFDEAVSQIVKAIGCGLDRAHSFARTAEREGNATVFSGSFSDCERTASTLGATGLTVSVAQ